MLTYVKNIILHYVLKYFTVFAHVCNLCTPLRGAGILLVHLASRTRVSKCDVIIETPAKIGQDYAV